MIKLEMDRHDMCVKVHLEETQDGYEVNSRGILDQIEKLLSAIELYDHVDIEIKRDERHLVNQ